MTNPNATQEDSELLDMLAHLNSVAELAELVADITDEESELLASIDLDADPTAEELNTLGPDFTHRLLERTMSRLAPQSERHYRDIFLRLQGFTLLELLQEMEAGGLLQNVKARQLAEDLVASYARRLERSASTHE